MDEVERVTIELPVSFLEEVREAVAAGEYTSFDKAIEQAVHDWVADRMIERIGVDELKRLVDEGLASGDPQPMDFDALRAEIEETARQRVAASAHG